MVTKDRLVSLAKKPITIFVALPFLCFAIYEIAIATPRFESQTQLLVQQPDSASTLDPTTAFLSGLAGVSDGNDTELVRTYIHSNDMLQYIDEQLHLIEHYSDSSIDIFSRLLSSASRETKLAYFQNKIDVEIDDKSFVITVRAQGFEPEFTQALSQAIADRAEWYINTISNQLAEAQLSFVMKEHENIEKKLENAKLELMSFQRKYNLLDPTAEGIALQQITSQFDAQIAAKQAELTTLRSSMSDAASPVIQVRQELVGLMNQQKNERHRMTSSENDEDILNATPNGINEILAKYTEYQINTELALTAYTSSQISIEKSRIEAYRQLKYLVSVEAPILPDDSKYPNVFYNLSLFLVFNLMIFGLTKLILATIKEIG